MISDTGLTPEQVAVLNVLAPRWKPGVGSRLPIFEYAREMPPTDAELIELTDAILDALKHVCDAGHGT